MKVRTTRACTIGDQKRKAGDVVDVPDRIALKLIGRGLVSADLKAKSPTTSEK